MKKQMRISMDLHAQIKILLERGYSRRKISEALSVCRKTVTKVCDELYGDQTPKSTLGPDWLKKVDSDQILKDLGLGVSYKTLFYENAPKIEVNYWTFWKTFKKILESQTSPQTTMRLCHKPAEKTFVDFCDGIDVIDLATGRRQKTHLFIGTLPFSSYVFAEFVFSQKLPNFIRCFENMWTYFGGVTPYVVIDNLKSGVTNADLYDPDVNKTFVAYANHAGFAVLPARPRRPKDKANVESHAGIFQRSFFERVRNKTFCSLAELNQELKHFLEEFLSTTMKDHGASRNQRFEKEQEKLLPIPLERFDIPEWREAKVHPDCHIQFKKSMYSVPWQFVGKTVRVKSTNQMVEIFDLGTLEKIAVHKKSQTNHQIVTNEQHWPPDKRESIDFSTERAKAMARNLGEKTGKMVEYWLSQKHPLQYLRRTQGWLRQSRQYSKAAIEYAAEMSLKHHEYRLRYLSSCATFYDKGGIIGQNKTTVPNRNGQTIYLQKERNDK